MSDVRELVPGHPEWPARLADAPEIERLWVRGPASLAELTDKSIAIVGARAATSYGQHVADELACALAERNVTIISGGAFGIDISAHRGALSADGGRTVAVLGGGFDHLYPREHAQLFEFVASDGLLVSQYPPHMRPARHQFLERNRLVAALCGGLIVVEANMRSGSLHAAREACELHRTVMAVPGPVTSLGSEGCHELIRERHAALVTNSYDVLETMRSRAPARA